MFQKKAILLRGFCVCFFFLEGGGGCRAECGKSGIKKKGDIVVKTGI